MAADLLNGLALGALLMVLASGLAMIFGLRDVVNFAHGALYMLGAYVGLTLSEALNFWLALILTPAVFGLVGALLDRFGLRYIAGRDHLDMILITFGVSFVLTGAVQALWGTQPRSLPAPAGLRSSVSLGGDDYPVYRLFLIVFGIAVCAALVWWLGHSRIGLHVRASSTERTAAGVVGVDVDKVSATVVGVGAALAGLSGVIAGPYLSLSPNMGVEILVLTFIVVVTGGLGSLGGAMVAALILGLISSFSVAFVPSLSAYAPYALMLVVLLLRPRGIAGVRTA